jgi:hypothetical protein
MGLQDEFERIKRRHKKAICSRLARATIGPSIARVFAKGSVERMWRVLPDIPVDELLGLKEQEDFKRWFEKQLDKLATRIKETNSGNAAINLDGGYKWGHATKILCLYLRDVVAHREYFASEDAARIMEWLYVPIDSINMARLRRCGVSLDFAKIKEVDTPDKFYSVQNALGEAAKSTGVPRIWFDDNWADREA